MDKKTVKKMLTLGRKAVRIKEELDELSNTMDIMDRFYGIPFGFTVDKFEIRKLMELGFEPKVYSTREMHGGDGWYEFNFEIDGVPFWGYGDESVKSLLGQ